MSKTELTCIVTKEVSSNLHHTRLSECGRINQPGAMFGPVPHFHAQNWLTEFFQRNACPPAPGDRNYQAAVEEGLLVSAESGRWYPIRNFIPELLPDHLRDFERDFAFLEGLRSVLPQPLFERLNDRNLFGINGAAEDTGSHYKRAEMSVATKVENDYFVPGLLSPFNPGAPDHSIYFLRLFSFSLPLLHRDGSNKVFLDCGCGYAWSTEWLLRLGYEPIGLDITRTYLDIAVKRLGPDKLPHLVLADVESVPIRDGAMDSVYCYESFHHIPNREQAMKEFFRIIKPGKSVVLAEPGAEHELAQGPIDVMEKFGILERGMDLTDVERYIEGTGFSPPREHHVLEFDNGLVGSTLNAEFLKRHRSTPSYLYSVERPLPVTEDSGGHVEPPDQMESVPEPRSMAAGLKRRLGSLLTGLKS